MNDDDVVRALEEVEHELANIEAEITGPTGTPATRSAAVFQSISLASLSLQCRSMTLIDVVNVSLNSRNMPTSWAQNEARCGHATSPLPACNLPMHASASVHHHASAAAVTAPGRVINRNASNSWKRCLFAAGGFEKPLATAWLDVLHAADTAHDTCYVPSSVLRFLPLIDPLLADYAARDVVVHVSRRDLQVHAVVPFNEASFTILLQMLSAATLFALSSSPSCALLQVPLADIGVNQLLSSAFGDARGHEDVLWQGQISSAQPTSPEHHLLCRALYIAGVDSDDDCRFEKACKWSRFAAVVRSTCTGAERTSLRVLCTSSSASSPPSQQSVAPHCVSITISPQPASAPSNIELCVRWVAVVIRESRSSNASCLVLLLRYMSYMMRLTTSANGHNRSRSSQAVSIAEKTSSANHASAASLASSQGITSALRASLQGGNMSPEAWSGVRQLILLRTKRKAAEAALNSFMLAGGGGESEQIKQEPAPVSTLVLNCFVDVIGQQEFYPNAMSVALEEFYHVLASMQVNSSFCAFIFALYHLDQFEPQVDRQSPAAASISLSGDSTSLCALPSAQILILVQRCMKQTANMMSAAIGAHDDNASTTVTNEVCLRRCVVYLQKLQLWLLGSSSPVERNPEDFLMPCPWLQLKPVYLPLDQLRHVTECLFPRNVMSRLCPASESAAKASSCFIGSKFENHLLLALLHPSITLPMDNFVKMHVPLSPSGHIDHSRDVNTWCDCSMLTHSLQFLRMAVRKFVQSFSCIGKPSDPQSADFLKFVHELQAHLIHTILLLLRYSTQPPETLPLLLPFHEHPSPGEVASKSGTALLLTTTTYREILPLIDNSHDETWQDVFACFTPMSMHAIALLARPDRRDAAAHAHATLSLMSVWSTSYGDALLLRQGARAVEWESGACAHLATTTTALMRSFVSPVACEQAVSRCSGDVSSGIHSQHHVLGILSSGAEVFAFLYRHALTFLPLAAPTAAQEFLLDDIMNEWRRSKAGSEGSQEFRDAVQSWELNILSNLRESMTLQRCTSVQESLLLSVPVFLQYTDTCIRLFRTANLHADMNHAKNLYVMRGMSCPCAPCHPITAASDRDIVVPLLMHTVYCLAEALAEGLSLVDICMKSCVTSRTTLMDLRKSSSNIGPAPFRSQCTLLLASSSAWSAFVRTSGIAKNLNCLIRDTSVWLLPTLSSSASPSAAAAAADFASVFEAQKNSMINALQLLQSGLIQTVQSIDELESGVDSSIVAYMDVEMKCLGPTYLGRRAFCDWASLRYPEMENYIFQPHSLSKRAERRDVEVLFATQAGFLCALHADAVLAPELHLAGVSSICTQDCVVSLSEMFNNSASFGSSAIVREQAILLSDVVERLVHSANPTSVYIIDNGMEMKSRGLNSGSDESAVLHSCRNTNVHNAILDMCRLENMLVCVRMSFLTRALSLPLPQLKLFLFKNSDSRQLCDDPYVWLARDVTITSIQASFSSQRSRWKSIVAAASASNTVACLWRQQWRLLWQRAGLTPQLHGIAGTTTCDADMESAFAFEKDFFEWAQASCRSLWNPAVGYCACVKMVEKALETICCMMEVPTLQKCIYSRIGGDCLLDVVSPHRRHLKLLQLWMEVLSRLARLTPQTTSGVSGAVIELQGNTLRACDATLDMLLQALQPVTFLPHGVDWRSFWKLVHSAALPPNINRERAIAHDFIFAFESTFLAPAPLLSSLILARKPPVALLYKVDVLHETRANAMLASTRFALAASCITTMSTDHSTRRRLSSSNIGSLIVTVGLKSRSSATFLLMSAAALRSFSLEAEMWVHDERRNIICILYAAVRQHAEADLLLRQCACIGSNMLQKSYSQTFNALVINFDLSPGCSFAMHCCQRLFRLQLRSRPLCDTGHKGHATEIQRLLLWTSLVHFLGNSCTSNSPEGMTVGGMLLSAGFLSWLKSTVPGFTAIIPTEPLAAVQSDDRRSVIAPSTDSRKQSQSGLQFIHTANTHETYTSKTTQDGSEELNLTKSQRVSTRPFAQGSAVTFARRPTSGIRTDTFDSWSQHGMRSLVVPPTTTPQVSAADSGASSTSLLKHALPVTASVVEAAICHLVRLISNFGELLPSILVTAPYDTERADVQAASVTPPSVNGMEHLCHPHLLSKLLDFFEASLQYRSAALHAASVLLKMQGNSTLDPDVLARIQAILNSICRRYFPKIMKSELHEFVCIAPRSVPSIPSAAELHQLVGVAYESVDQAIQQLLAGTGVEDQ